MDSNLTKWLSKTTPEFSPASVIYTSALFALFLGASTASCVEPLRVSAWGQNNHGQGTAPIALESVVAVAAGYSHNLAITSAGKVVAWGDNNLGQTNVPPELTNVLAVAASQQSMALRSDGSIVVWGHPSALITNVPAAAANSVGIAAGLEFNLALKSDGTVVGWGSSSYQAADVPAGLNQVTAIAAGWYHGVALRNDGTVVAWGNNESGQTNVPAGLTDVVAISTKESHNLALRRDGSVVAWGRNDYGQATVPVGLTDVAGISAGSVHSLAVRSNGTVVAWGYNGNGQTNVPAELVHVVGVSGGAQHSVALVELVELGQTITISAQPQGVVTNIGATVEFAVVAFSPMPLNHQWQKNGNDLPNATNASLVLANVQASDAANYTVVISHSAASVTSSIATLTIFSPPTIVNSPRDATSYVGGSAFFSAQIASDLPVTYLWFKNGASFGSINSSTLVLGNVQLADAGSYTLVAMNSAGSVTSAPANLIITNRPEGTVVGLGSPIVPPGLTNIVAVSVGGAHCLALRSDGTVAGWGSNLFGEATPPAGLSNVVAIAAGRDFSVVLKSDGTVATWGFSSKIEKMPIGLSGVIGIAAAQDYTVAVKADGTVVTWGGIFIPPPPGSSNFVAVAAANQFSRGLRSDGTVVLPGFLPWETTVISNVVGIAAGRLDNSVILHGNGTVQVYGGGLSVPAGLSNVVAISSGLALRSDGTVVGLNGTVPTDLTNVVAVSGGVGAGLVITRNPPAPVLTANASGTNVTVAAPVSVSGYALEAADSPAGPFVVIETFTNAPAQLNYPTSGPRQYYRLRKL